MITKRLSILQLFLLLGLSLVFLIPRHVRMEAAAINLSLPDLIGDWDGKDQAVTQGERDILGPDTQIMRKVYANGRGDQISVSVVFSGPDMNTSIHRPERCLPAQGWTVADTQAVTLPTAAGNLRMTRLHNMRSVRTESGRSVSIYDLNYYWFVGHDSETGSHFERTWIDIRDRLLKGRNQQWAYVTVAGMITKDLQMFGRTEKETDELIQAFVSQLAPKLQKSS